MFTVVLDPPSPDARIREVLNRWRLFVGGLVLVAWLFLAVGGGPRPGAGAVAAVVLLLIAAVLPFQEIESLFPVFDGLHFQAPGLPVSLGRLAVLALGAVTVISVTPRPRLRLHPLGAGVLAAVVFPLVLLWLDSGLRQAALAEGQALWIVYQGTTAVLLTLVAGTALALVRWSGGGRVEGLAAAGLAAALGAAVFRFDSDMNNGG